MSDDEFFEYRKNRDICLKGICSIVYYAENVLIYEDVDKFPDELKKAVKFLLEILKWKKELACYKSLHALSDNAATLEDFQVIVESKNTYKEMIILRLSNQTIEFYEEKEREREEEEEIVVENYKEEVL